MNTVSGILRIISTRPVRRKPPYLKRIIEPMCVYVASRLLHQLEILTGRRPKRIQERRKQQKADLYFSLVWYTYLDQDNTRVPGRNELL